MDKGKLIVIEGLDGSGKATQASRLLQNLQKAGLQVLQVTFPNYESPSSALVKMYLDGEFGTRPQDVNPYAASSFYAVDRYASYRQFWGEAYHNGKVILADRYTTSNAVYQLTKTQRENWDVFLDWVEDYEYGKLQLPRPDLVLYLDMPVQVSQKLMTQRYGGDESKKDLHEKNRDFLIRCRQSALYAAKRWGWEVIPCAQGEAPRAIETIESDIMQKVQMVL
ncbi:MAG: deoxynucleoside kinase [Acutalibacteraceae bacterium]|nr:deoxynucleoside kinase [Acutalibacteraceae bacterium]HIR04115.1 thymidylate kinase [Candidatus Scatovicinus merdipullorum]